MNRYITIFFSLLTSTIALSQGAFTSSGGTTQSNYGSVSFSIGQIAYTSIDGSNGSVNSGVQQAFEVLATNGIEESTIQLHISAYPNPTVETLTLFVEDYSELLSYTLTDINGKLILEGRVNNSETAILMKNLANGNYYLNVKSLEDTSIKTFQIIKSK